MLKRDYIEFKKGSILSSQMLTTLYEEQKSIWDIQYHNFCDGIINGLDFSIDNDTLFLSPGIVMFGGEIFSMRDSINISSIISQSDFVDEGETLSIILTRGKSTSSNGVTTSRLNTEVTRNRTDGDFILGEMLYRKNILPKVDLESFVNLLDTQNNYINISNRKYSMNGEATCDPTITHLFAKELIKKNYLTTFDHIMLTLSMNKTLIEHSLLVQYLGSHSHTYSLDNLILLFSKILHTEKPKVTSQVIEEVHTIEDNDEYM